MKSCIVGKFESFHRGHQKLISKAKNLANEVEILSIWPPPGSKNPLFTHRERELLARKFEVNLHNLQFKDIKNMTPEQFFIFLKKCNCNFLVVGADWRFGRNREGNVKTARRLGKAHGIKVITVHPVSRNGKKISTSWIKELLSNGDVREANQLLGFNFFAIGKSTKGRGIGRTLGFPTINIKTEKELILPFGVYEVFLEIGNKTFAAVANYGIRPTFNKSEPVLEVHIPGELLNIQEEVPLKIEFINFIRGEKRFKSVEELKKQIKLDVDRILNKKRRKL
ncbi:riboflavin biosynthesis protein RibF [Desulfurobacterium sp.]